MGEELSLVKPANDKREYRSVTLPNQLQVLLISDVDTDKAAAAMAVNVGYFSDPEDIPGLAHFLEHMLFYSSEKYPVEDSYSIFLNEHGGRSNAYTTSEHTNYHLDVSHEFLEDALDRFAQFFICPLMSADATNREMNAVDSENSKNLTSDLWRMNQLNKSLSSASHPFHKYGTGNLETLDANPRSKGQDTREELIKFYEAHYSANLMRLVVYGRNSLDELEATVMDKFSSIKNKDIPAPKFQGSPMEKEHSKLLVKAVPVAEGHSLDLYFLIPPEIRNYQSAPSRYLGHLIGHEAEGSLFAALKAKGWATSLSAGETDSSSEYAFFGISIELTDQGQDRVPEVVAHVFEYIKILQTNGGVAEWIFDEVKAICETKFHFQDKRPPFQYTTGLAVNMLLYPQEDWLAAASLPRQFDREAIVSTLDSLTPDNLRALWTSKQFESEATEVEKWYGTKYTVSVLPDSFLQVAGSEGESLHLPVKNEFIPTDFSLRQPLPDQKYPTPVYSSPKSRLWFKSDPIFRTPKANIVLDFSCPAAYASPESSVLTRLFTKLLVDDLNEHAYYAEIAGLSYSVQPTILGFQVTVSGYSHKLRLLAQKVVEKVVNFKVREDRFRDVKEKVLRDFLNFRYEQPYQQALYRTSVILEYRRWCMEEYLDCLPGMAAEDLTAFFPSLLSRFFLEALVCGNFTESEATEFIRHVEEALVNSKPMFGSQLAERRIVSLQPSSVKSGLFHPTGGLNPDDGNSALLFYLQVGPDAPRSNMLAQLFVQTATRDAFHQLRSVEQLGYIVFLVPRNDYGIQGVQCIIQSNVKSSAGLEERVEAFLQSFEQKLMAMSVEEFETHVNALVAVKEERHKNLQEETRFYWKEIDDGTLMFDRVLKEVEALKNISLSDLQSFFGSFVKQGGSQRRKLSTQIFGSGHSKDMEAKLAKAKSGEDGLIEDIYAFKRSQVLFGSLKGRIVLN